MELKKRNFFGENGLTQTSANYIANKAKEYVNAIGQRYEHFNFYSTSISLIGSEAKTSVSDGITPDEVKDFPRKLMLMADAKALIAYLREAIKERTRLLNAAKAMPFEHPELGEAPEMDKYLTEEDIIQDWSAEKLNRYYRLQAIASTFGGFVHPNGPYHEARERFLKMKQTEASIDGASTLIKYNTASVHPADVDGMFFEMQEKQREAQAEYNGFRHEIELALEQNKIAVNKKFRDEMEEYNLKLKNAKAWDMVERDKLVEDILALKIVIPENLKDIYNKISSKTSLA